MAEPKYLLVPQVFGPLCKGCYLRGRRDVDCPEFIRNEIGPTPGYCTHKVVIENTPEALARFAAAKLEGNDD